MTVTHRAAVSSFDDLLRPFGDGINAWCWPRRLAGDFAELAQHFAPDEGLRVIAPSSLRTTRWSDAGRIAADAVLDDLRRLDALGYDPVLNCIASYPRDERGLALATDVMSFHVDRAPVDVDTWICTYYGKSSEGLAPADAHRLIDRPSVRAALLKDYGGPDDDGFAAFIREGSFDLHYAAADGARAFSFGVGNLWRIAVAWPGSPVPPCVHRAPATEPGDAPRLMLIC